MTNLQFRLLFRVFLLRVVDLEILAAEGDPVRLLGQFAALFAAISLLFSLPLIVMGGSDPEFARETAHFLVATTMLVVGLLSILNWDAASPDRTDAMVLSPLPIPSKTIFLAKLSALACPLGLAVLALNVFSGLFWPLYFAPSANPLELLRSYAAYWITTLAASCFMFFFVLALQGLASKLLPYQIFLRISAWIQMTAFCVFLGTYILEPSLESPPALAASANHNMLACLPSYWFWGLFQYLNGADSPSLSHSQSIYAWLATRAWIALALIALAAASTWSLSFRRFLRKIIEEPTIVARRPWLRAPALLHDSLSIAITFFCLHTLMRSRFHRVILSFYLGAGLALVLVYVNVLSLLHPDASFKTSAVNPTCIGASVLMMLLVIAGIRVLAGIPIALKANWTFRITEIYSPAAYLRATRIAILATTVLPVWLASASFFLLLWPWHMALGHLCILLLLGLILAEVSLYRFHKIPFTCSYMPGKGNLQFVFWAFALILLPLINAAAHFEFRILNRPISLCSTFALLTITLFCARTYNTAQANALREIKFDEAEAPEILSLHLGQNQS
jgi:hypothetical protein